MASDIFRPGRNVWRVEEASRAAMLVDGAAFFAAVRGACLKAERRILMVGWDIDSRTRLIGETEDPGDGYPAGFVEFLTELVRRKPGLQIDLLLWDYSVLYAHEREVMPRLSLQWRTPDRINLCLDSTVPFGSSQHQKVIVVDDAVALSGGLDVTIRRWDTSRHNFEEPLRVDPSGKPYPPFHDVQMMVDGDAARALAELARRRWCRVHGGVPAIEPVGDPWPDGLAPDFHDVDIGISRTQVRCGEQEAVREVEQLFLDAIDHAEHSIYIENQFLTSIPMARRLARRLRQRRELEVVIVAPHTHHSWIEQHTMRNGRIRFWHHVRRAGGERVRLVYPSVEKDGQFTDTMIHSKVMVVDDRFLRVGSANLNNRSMGADTECDLAIDASNDAQRRAIVRQRNRLLGDHCGVGPDAVAAELARHGSLVQAADRLGANGHCLRPIDDGKPDRNLFASVVEQVADPDGVLNLRGVFSRTIARLNRTSSRTGAVAFGIALAMLALTVAWKFFGLGGPETPAELRGLLADSAGQWWAPALVVAMFMVGAAVCFPVTMLILATAATYGPVYGAIYSLLGVVASGAATYWIGARYGQATVGRVLGDRWPKARDSLRRRGVLAVVAVRVVPTLPFTLINLAIGASAIRPVDFVVGTVIGMGPGLVMISIMGDRLVSLVIDPSAAQIALFAACIVGWIALSIAAQSLLSRLGARPS